MADTIKRFWNYSLEHPITTILSVAIGIRLLSLLFHQSLWWDSHVYIGMAKYLFSNGELGIWEPFRALLHPLLIGIVWKLKISPVIGGRILDIVFSTLSVYFLYRITEKIFDKKTAIISALFFGVAPLFLMFTGLILADPLSIFLGLLGVYFFTKQETKTPLNLTLAGFFCGLAFLAKFPQGIYLAGLGLLTLIYAKPFVEKIKQGILLTIGFIIATTPFFIFNYYTYGNPLEPLTSASWIVTTGTWLYGSGIFFYFKEFFFKNPIHLLSIPFIYYFFKEKQWKDQHKILPVLMTIIIILYFITVPRKELRYMIGALPFVAMFIGYSVIKLHHYFKKQKKPFIHPSGLVAVCIILTLSFVPGNIDFNNPPTLHKEVQQIITDNNITGPILSSHPFVISYFDNKPILLSGMDYGEAIYEREKNNYGIAVVNSCDFHCAPEDADCHTRKAALLNTIAEENTQVFQTQHTFKKDEPPCIYTIYLPTDKPTQ